MTAMERSRAAVLAGSANAGVFEVLTLLATQDETVWSASPWREDPYHTAVSLAALAVPVIGGLILLRLLVWSAPGAVDRARQTVRATGVMTALIGGTLLAEWAGVAVNGASWRSWTATLLSGLIVTSALAVAVTALLRRCRRPSGRWRNDWLGDITLLAARIPLLRRWAGPPVAEWVRQHALAVFSGLSVSAAAVVTAFQAVGERWTDPVLILWLLAAVTAAGIAFCLIGNAVIGFVARPASDRTRRIAEAALVALTFGTGAVTAALFVLTAITASRIPEWRRSAPRGR